VIMPPTATLLILSVSGCCATLLADIPYFNSLACSTTIRFYSQQVVNQAGTQKGPNLWEFILGRRDRFLSCQGRARFADQEEADYESNELDDCIAFQGFDALWLRFSLNDLRPVLLLERAKYSHP
jgi:hypothetical protein